MLSSAYIKRLEGDQECIEALAWLAVNGKGYKSGGFTPPLSRKKPAKDQTKFLAITLRIGRRHHLKAGSRITRVDTFDGVEASSCIGTESDIADGIASRLFAPAYSGYLFVTSGKRRQALDAWLDSIGPYLLQKGYEIQPCLSSGGVSWVMVRKGKYKWTMTYFETMTGVEVSIGAMLATTADLPIVHQKRTAQYLHCAIVVVARLYMAEFGSALRPTVGMIAMDAARGSLPVDFRKWRPAPLLVAMEREGKGYRGGMTYAQRWRGHTVQVDVTRQYTYSIARELPHEWVFGPFPGFQNRNPGVYMCRVRIGNRIPYPIGIWQGTDAGFVVETVSRGEYVCVLHSPEIRSIIRAGGAVWPTYGYTATRTFSFGDHANHLQQLLTRYGRDSPIALLSKPLGNYVYGKLGQNPKRIELSFSDQDKRPEWYPYFDEYGNAWDNVWERQVEKYSASQHIDVAGYITSLARSMTCDAWLQLSDAGANVLRCHTDSLTVDHLPESFRLSNGDEIGGWRVDAESDESIIVGANAYFDEDGPHIAGVTHPTYEMVEKLYDSGFTQVQQRIRKPRRGFGRGEEDVTREMRATAR